MTEDYQAERGYSYPDSENRITTCMITERTRAKVLWEKSEKTILDYIEEYIKKSHRSWLFDAGCGTGRLLPRFQVYFDKILAVDRDANQLRKAKDLAKTLNFEDKVVFKVTSVQNLSWLKGSIDTILCSHLIQHLSTQSVSLVAKKFWALARTNGHLFVLTTHARNQDHFTKEYLKHEKLIEEKISEAEFNSLIENKDNILPIHYFSKKSISNIMRESGFRSLDFKLFHKVTNVDPTVGQYRDMLLVCQKPS